MRKLMLSLIMAGFTLIAFAQKNEEVKRLVSEGIALHDKGDYDGAIKKYDEALNMDAGDYDANYEKSLSLLYAKKYDDCTALCKTIIEKFPGNPNLRQVYSN